MPPLGGRMEINMKIKVSDYIVERLHEEKIDIIFGYQGGNISHLIDSIGNSSSVKFVENYHEQGAAFAANSYAQVNETIGVAVASSGPGAINLLNGIANAFCDSIPCLFFTGDVNTTAKKKNGSCRQNAFQEINILPMAVPITKYCVSITSANDIVDELDKGIQIAKSGRKGPVLINLPHDIQRTIIETNTTKRKSYKESAMIDSSIFEKVLQVLSCAKRPVIIVGGGMRSSQSKKLLKKLLDTTAMPVVSSLLGLDVISHDHFCYRGMIGSYGNRGANLCLKYSDCILALGTRLDDRQIGTNDIVQFENKKIIHVDIDIHEIENKLDEDISIVGEVSQFLEKLILEDIGRNVYSEWLALSKKISEKYISYEQNPKEMHPNDFIRKLSESTKGVYTLDVGNNQMYSAQSLFVGEDELILSSGGLGAMGYSLPAAIGASLSKKIKKVYCITGDGGLQMNLQELQTINVHQLPINIIVLNNNALGMIYDLQTKMFSNRFFGTIKGYSAPDFSKIAKAYNFKYFKVNDVEDYEKAIELLKAELQVFVEMKIDVTIKTNPDPGNGIFEQSPFVDQEDLYFLRGV